LIAVDGEPIPLSADTDLNFAASVDPVEIPTLHLGGLALMLMLLALSGLVSVRHRH